MYLFSGMRYVLQKQKSNQYYTPVNNFSFFLVRVHRIIHLPIKKRYTNHYCYNDIEPLLNWRSLRIGSCLCLSNLKIEFSLNLPFASFSRKSETVSSQFSRNPTSWSFGKGGLGQRKVEETLKNALIQTPNFGLSTRRGF